MTIDEPSSTVAEPARLVAPVPETLRHAMGGVRQALLGIELTLVAGLVVLFLGATGLAGLGAGVLGGVGLILVVTGSVAPSAQAPVARPRGAAAPKVGPRSS